MDQLRSLHLSRDGDDKIWILAPPNLDDCICSQRPRNEDVGQAIDENMLDSDYDDSLDESSSSSSNGDDNEDLNNNGYPLKNKSGSPPRFWYRDFLPAYRTFFKDLGMTLPFMNFQLNAFNFYFICPSQLHTNGWAFVLAFEKFCGWVNASPSISLFRHIFVPYRNKQDNKSTREKLHWKFVALSFKASDKCKLLEAYESSYNEFKDEYSWICPLKI